MLASITSSVLVGAEGHRVTVEVHVANGLPSFSVVGLPDESVREARDRVRAAVLSSGVPWPAQRITVNLAPSQQRKSGSGLDLAIAVGILVAAGEIERRAVENLAFIAELGLDGTLRAVPGVAPMVGVLGEHDVVVAPASGVEAEVAALGRVRLVAHLRPLVEALRGEAPWPDLEPEVPATVPRHVPDLADVLGQPLARRALEIAAAGGHHLLFVGPPGAGKSMLASRLPGLLPPLDREQALAVTMVHSAAGIPLPAGGLVTDPPFRAPHHTSSMVAVIGGGSHNLRPGEVSLASSGTLFLDELAEFPPRLLDCLRQPLENRVVNLARSNIKVTLPADFLLVAAMNPCPCGGGPPGQCECGEAQVARYLRRVSGPLLDRFDLRVPVAKPGIDELLGGGGGEPSSVAAARVAAARALAQRRQGMLNARLDNSVLDEVAPLEPAASAMLRREVEEDRLTARGYYRMRRVARTIADLAAVTGLGSTHDAAVATIDEATIALALCLRSALGRSARRRAA